MAKRERTMDQINRDLMRALTRQSRTIERIATTVGALAKALGAPDTEPAPELPEEEMGLQGKRRKR